jgi:hypothetical protein
MGASIGTQGREKRFLGFVVSGQAEGAHEIFLLGVELAVVGRIRRTLDSRGKPASFTPRA